MLREQSVAVMVVAAGRAPRSRSGWAWSLCRVDHGPDALRRALWNWADEVPDVFEKLARDKLGLSGGAGWIEAEAYGCGARVALLARSWDEHSLRAYGLLAQAAVAAAESGGASASKLHGSGWGNLGVEQIEAESRCAIEAIQERGLLRRLCGAAPEIHALSL